ncbi:MAG: non-hydrolyzing UDP-N-acetylglucosamine 2-epimerase [Acidimicrobiales bacterium]
MRVLCVAGARPNFMKVKPVLDALDDAGAATFLVHTGQHYDPRMSDVFFDDLRLRPPDRRLCVGSGSHAEQVGRMMIAFEPLLAELHPDVVVVVGDVNSTLACALVAAKHGALVAHVEAGLRSRDWGMPEEVNRVVADRVSDYLFAPSGEAVDNLRREGYRVDQVHLVGNVMIDTLLANLERARARPVLDRLGMRPEGYGLVTLHRPSNVDVPEVLDGLLVALGKVAESCPLVFPVHPRTSKRLSTRAVPPGLTLVEPTGYLDFIALEASARLVLTDSGAVQEETTALGVPCLTLRESTERRVTIEEGTNRLVGCDPERIIDAARKVLDDGVPRRCPALWDGKAGERVTQVLLDGGGPSGHLRPTDAVVS